MSALSLGLTPWIAPGLADAQTLGRQAELAEAWGYASFWLPENHFGGSGSIPEPLMLLAAVAGRTERIRLCTTSFLLPLRNPLQAAEQVAVLDQLSNGRVTLGIGRGYAPAMFSAFAVPRREKRAIFEWCFENMTKAWRGEPVALTEDATPVEVSPRPVQTPHPPIWVAAFGPKALQQAGRLGAPYLASPMEPLTRLQENYARHADACVAAGQPVPPEVPVMRSAFLSDDARQIDRIKADLDAQARQAAASGSTIRRPPAAVEDWAIVGSPAAVADQVAEYRETLGMTHLIVTRLRIGKVDQPALERSVAGLIELLG